MKKTITTIAALVCCSQLFGAPSRHCDSPDDWRRQLQQLSHQATIAANQLSNTAHHHLERHPSDVNQLRVLIAARGLATSVQDLSHQLEYVKADRHCLELLVSDVRERTDRLTRQAAALPSCRFHVQRDLVRQLQCISTALCAASEVLHRAAEPVRIGNHYSRSPHSSQVRFEFQRTWSRQPAFAFTPNRACY